MTTLRISALQYVLFFGLITQLICVNAMSISREQFIEMMKIGQGVPDLEGDCIQQEVLCMNCTYAIRCIEVPGGWMKVPQEVCDKGNSCNAKEGGCSKNVVPECDTRSINFKYTCEQVGVFPDPFDCRRFHMCAPHANSSTDEVMSQFSIYCPRHYSYDPITTQCRLKLPYGQCQERPVPLCTKVGQSGTHTSHNITSLYYVCLKKDGEIFPQMFICPFGYFYWPQSESCHADPPPPPTTTTAPPTTPTTPATTTLAPETTTPVATTPAPTTAAPTPEATAAPIPEPTPAPGFFY